MHLVDGSVTVVLVGDWNKFYIKPDWVAGNIYENSEIEIGIEGQDTDFRVSYRKDKVNIRPSQTKMVFSAADSQLDTLNLLTKCVNNFLQKAVTPAFSAFGLNVDYEDQENARLADVFDHMEDTELLLDLGYEIGTTQVSRSLTKDGKTLNVKCTIANSKTTISFNEHHATPDADQLEITPEMMQTFLQQTDEIVRKFGYGIDGE